LRLEIGESDFLNCLLLQDATTRGKILERENVGILRSLTASPSIQSQLYESGRLYSGTSPRPLSLLRQTYELDAKRAFRRFYTCGAPLTRRKKKLTKEKKKCKTILYLSVRCKFNKRKNRRLWLTLILA
jgi:hypothetical protein